MIYKFYDTCSLLLQVEHLFEEEHAKFVVSSITLQELEDIKTSSHKDADIKYSARKLLHQLEENEGKYEVHIFKNEMLKPFIEKDLEINNDIKILATAFDYDCNIHPDETMFVSNDLALRIIANLFFGSDSVLTVDGEDLDNYKGYQEVYCNDEELSNFYANLD